MTLRGNIASDPITLTTSKGEPMIRFRLAHQPAHYRGRAEGWEMGKTSFYDVVAFRSLARHAAASLSKGDPVVVTGSLEVQPWQKDDRSGLNVTLRADDIGHSLMRGVSSFTRATADEPRRPESPSSPEPQRAAFPTQTAFPSGAAIDPDDAETDDYVVRSA